MKLISLYIDNFGKLSDYSFDFSKSMNSIYEENGWGKTTLTVFIKSMLYGLSKNERSQYTPWKNLSSFGGYLIMEANGREYRIERQFSPSKASADVFKIYDLRTNLQIDNLSTNLGESILNLNEASFERSVFIPQKDLDEGFGSDIEAKLANLIGGTNDSQSFEAAIEILKDKTKELKLNSKKGLIIDKKMELNQIEDEIAECNTRMEGLPILQKSIDQISSKISDLTNEKKTINNRILMFTKTQDKRAKLEVVSKYEEDIKLTESLLAKNNEVFNGHNVTVDEVLSYRAKNKELQNLRTQYEVKKQNNRASLKIATLEKDININEIPDEETIEHITEQIMKHNNIKSVIQAHKAEPKEKIKPKAGIALTILAGILFVIGVALFFVGFLIDKNSNNGLGVEIAGIAVAILAILAAIGALAAFIVTNQKNAALQVGGQVGAYDYEKIHLEEELREFFARYHLYSSDFTKNLFTVRSNIERYKDARQDFDDISRENKELETKIKEYENSILHFLGQFNSSDVCQTNEEKIGELNTHLRKKGEIEAQLAQKRSLLKNFISNNGLDSIDEAHFNVEEMNQKIFEIDSKIDDLNTQKTTYINKYQEYEKEISMYDEYLSNKEKVEAEIRSMEEEYRLINLSMDYLTLSQTSLLEKYVKPMKDSVNKYVSLLLKDSSDYSIDVNFKFQFVTNNGLKSIDSYSRGYQTIISLCMRLALIDCLYPVEKPFIILDDPFVNFDDEKLELCKALIRAISTNYQIVYFTCHQSRAIEGIKKFNQALAQKEAAKPQSTGMVKPMVLRPAASDSGLTMAPPVKPKPQVAEEVKVAPKPKPQEAEEVKVAPKPQTKRLSPEDALVESLLKTKPEDVKPQGVKVTLSRASTNQADGALGPMSGRTQTKAQPRTIKIAKK